MHNKPTQVQIQQILTGLGKKLIDFFRYRLRDGSIGSINDFKQRCISETVINSLAPDKVDFLVYNTVANEICFSFTADNGPTLHKYSDHLTYQDLKALKLVNESDEIVEIVTPINKAKELQNDLNILYKKTVAALNPKLEQIYEQIRRFDSVLKYSKYTAICFTATSLVPLLYTGFRTFISKSNNSLPYLACSTALLCLSGATLAIRHFLEKDISRIICNNITVNFSEPTLASTLFTSLDASPETARKL